MSDSMHRCADSVGVNCGFHQFTEVSLLLLAKEELKLLAWTISDSIYHLVLDLLSDLLIAISSSKSPLI